MTNIGDYSLLIGLMAFFFAWRTSQKIGTHFLLKVSFYLRDQKDFLAYSSFSLWSAVDHTCHSSHFKTKFFFSHLYLKGENWSYLAEKKMLSPWLTKLKFEYVRCRLFILWLKCDFFSTLMYLGFAQYFNIPFYGQNLHFSLKNKTVKKCDEKGKKL